MRSEELGVRSVFHSSDHFSGHLIPNLFNELTAALKSKNVVEIDRILEKLNEEPLDQKTKEILEKIYLQILMKEFESAIKTINEHIKAN